MVGAQFLTVAGLDKNAPKKGIVEMVDFVHRMVDRFRSQLVYAESASGIRSAFKSNRTAILIALEGGSQIENSLETLRTYYKLGIRYMTLTHESKSSEWAPAALSEESEGGLTGFGREVVREMNRLGMLVDLSHASPKVMRVVLEISDAPVIFSHSSADALVSSPRNVPDDVLIALKRNGGLVMVSFVPYFTTKQYADWYYQGEEVFQGLIKKHSNVRAAARREMSLWEERNPPPRVTVADVADHVEHIRRVAGVEHIGIGSDFDGMYGKIEGLEDVSGFPALFLELARRGWTDIDLRKLAGRNFLRVFEQAEAVAKRSKRPRKVSRIRVH
jgi:membrane dipeptidase